MGWPRTLFIILLRTCTQRKTDITTHRAIFRYCLFLAAEIQVIVVNFIQVDEVSLTIIRGIFEIKLFSTMFLRGRFVFSTLRLSIFLMLFRSGTRCFLRACRVKDSRATSNKFTTRNGNFDVRFLKMHEQILGLTRFSNFLSARLQKATNFLRDRGLQEK